MESMVSLSGSTDSNPVLRDPDVRIMLSVRDGDDAAFNQMVLGYQDRLVSSLATRDCSPDTPFSGDGDCQQANYLASQGAGTGAEVGAGCRAREVVSRDACTYQNFGLYPFRTGRWTCSARLWMSCPC